jgi:3-hydroxymyristoyl/3-hydroxydecanoyl-(acyl carrier protein) dehydratase
VNSPSSFEPIFKKIQRVNSSMTFDGLLTSESGVQLSAVKYVNYAAPYFPDHFPKKPVLPLTILLECKLNLAREFIERAHFATPYQAVEMRRIKMNDFVLPGDILICHVKVKRQDEHELVLSFRSEVEGKRVCVMELVLR